VKRALKLMQLAITTGIASFSFSSFAKPPEISLTCAPTEQMQPKAHGYVTIRFVGDIVLGNSHIVENIPTEWEKTYFSGVDEYLRSANLSIGNLEGALTNQTRTSKDTSTGRSFAFRFPPHYAELLRKQGFLALHVANNHSNDFGDSGYADSLEALKSSDIEAVGVKGKISYLNINGIKVAIVGFGYYPRQDMIQDLNNVRSLISKAKEEAKFVIATFHAGAEGSNAIWHSNQSELFMGEDRGNSVAFARAAIESGADTVVGHGPHVLRAIECYNGKPIFYSLGNFVGVGGLSNRGLTALSAIAGIRLNAGAEIKGIEFASVLINEKKIPQIDDRGFSAHLTNFLAENSRYPGTFIKVPTDASTAKEFDAWARPLIQQTAQSK
jgi:poly-gamma-glutamate capsule biosynthesis protein CapA/YwtB (metallophosphatase superfamily)